jgi:hypothetical protein
VHSFSVAAKPIESGVVLFMNRQPKFMPLAAIFLGVGILITCFLPSQILVVIVALVIIAVGVLCLKC